MSDLTAVPMPLVIGFFGLVIGFLILDLGVFNRRAHVVRLREALIWTGFWVSLSGVFCGFVYYYFGSEAALTYLTAYVVEQSLSVDNLFVFLLIFAAFRIPSELQHRVLFWGIIGALLMRAVCIVAGVAALERFHWLTYIFGAILIYGGFKTAFKDEAEDDDPSKGVVARVVRRFIPITDKLDGERFFTRVDGRLMATPLFLALITVEISDVIFAVDSIPAVLAISRDSFIVYTSNVFAILGLRSIYFALAHLMGLFRYLKYALSAILIFVGIKMCASGYFHVPTAVALGVIIGLLAAAILASALIKPQGESSNQHNTPS